MDNDNSEIIKWHHLLGKFLELLLTPVGITVQTDLAVMNEPPKSDILLMQKEHGAWTGEQLGRLPDGIRHSKAREILIEFKYTESISLIMTRKTLGMTHFTNLQRH